MSDDTAPLSFVIGQKYRDRKGEYTVVAMQDNSIVIERLDGRRETADAATKARIHQNIVAEHRTSLEHSRPHRSRRRNEPTSLRKELMDQILLMEADGADHSGLEIDRALSGLARDLGYSEEDVSGLNSVTGRSAFANDGDWAKAVLTERGLHEVIGTTSYLEGKVRRQCNVYRITESGRDELRKRG